MAIKNRTIGHRAWKVLRLALLWARKGGVFKRRLVTEMRLLPKYFKRLAHTTPPSQLYYCERQLSFDNTPMFQPPSSMRFHFPHIPCINPHVDFDYDFDDEDLRYEDATKGEHNGVGECGYEEEEEEEEEGIDVRAEEFIARFYEQMKLQKQISYLHYTETPTRDAC